MLRCKVNLLVAVGLAFGICEFAQAQDQMGPAPGSLDVRTNVTAGALASRAPGNMVSAAIARATGFIAQSKAGTQVTDTAPPPRNIIRQLRLDSLQTVLTNLNLLVNALENVLRAQIGLGPVAPMITNFPSGGSGNGNGNVGNIPSNLPGAGGGGSAGNGNVGSIPGNLPGTGGGGAGGSGQ